MDLSAGLFLLGKRGQIGPGWPGEAFFTARLSEKLLLETKWHFPRFASRTSRPHDTTRVTFGAAAGSMKLHCATSNVSPGVNRSTNADWLYRGASAFGRALFSKVMGTQKMLRTIGTFALLVVAGSAVTACGLAGWQGEPETRPQTITGFMDVQDVPERDMLWTIETDTASFVPEEELPSDLREEGLRVRAQGIVREPPDYYPEGYLFDVNTVSILND